MTAIDTSMWPSSGSLHQQTTSYLNTYVNNGTNQFTLNETGARFNSGSHRERRLGIKVINSPNTTGGIGKSVRPPQRFTRQLTGGGHVHFILNLEAIRLYGNSVDEGGETSVVPTGVIGIGIETLRLSSVADTTNFPTGNDAEVEIDICIFDQDNDQNRAYLVNYPISNTGLGTTWDPFSNSSVLWRGALGVSPFDRTYLFHNTQSNAWTFTGGWTLQNMWADSGRWVVNYRIHDAVAPYTTTNSVQQSGLLNINPGVYTPSEPPVYVADNAARITLGGVGSVEVGSQVSPTNLTGGNRIELLAQRMLLTQGRPVAGANSLVLAAGGQIQAGSPVVSLSGGERLTLHGVGALGGEPRVVSLVGGNSAEGFSLEVIRGVIGDIVGGGGSGFVPTVIYWYRR